MVSCADDFGGRQFFRRSCKSFGVDGCPSMVDVGLVSLIVIFHQMFKWPQILTVVAPEEGNENDGQ